MSAEGRGAVVTGANRGVGLALVLELRARGCSPVIAGYRRRDGSRELLDAADRDPGIVPEALDVCSAESARRFGDACAEWAPRIVLVVNNAGIGATPGSILDSGPEEFEKHLQTHVIGPLRVVHAVLPLLGEGAVIANVSSVLGSVGTVGSGPSGYAAAKCAQNALTRQLAAALRARQVTCIAVHPGWVRTEIGGDRAPLSPADSAHGLATVLLRSNLSDTDRFVDYQGRDIPW